MPNPSSDLIPGRPLSKTNKYPASDAAESRRVARLRQSSPEDDLLFLAVDITRKERSMNGSAIERSDPDRRKQMAS
jgi:hypothetical protein